MTLPVIPANETMHVEISSLSEVEVNKVLLLKRQKVAEPNGTSSFSSTDGRYGLTPELEKAPWFNLDKETDF